ncbi:MAG: hypothetical protein IJO56_00250 [Oscillospiraceae bacterium]|nr:hypothetical protein [Oscillospiraceae bacterium]
MKKFLRIAGKAVLCIAAAGLLLLGGITVYVKTVPFGFAREVSEQEQQRRLQVVAAAESWLGCREEDGTHQAIVDLYNCHTPLAQGYLVQYTDDWCATFGSAAAIQSGMTDIIPTECGCQRQIGLFQDMLCWVEEDDYVPLPGDYIFYCRTDDGIGDCTGWSDHVGIVVGTAGPFIKVIEGNYGNSVSYHVIAVNAPKIRGYGTPNYENAAG